MTQLQISILDNAFHTNRAFACLSLYPSIIIVCMCECRRSAEKTRRRVERSALSVYKYNLAAPRTEQTHMHVLGAHRGMVSILLYARLIVAGLGVTCIFN